MTTSVLLDSGVVNRCRRRVHLEHDPTMADAPTAPPDPTGEQRKADAAAHRRSIADEIAGLVGPGWTEIPRGSEVRASDREQMTLDAMAEGARFIWAPQLPRDEAGGRRGHMDLLVAVDGGYVPVLVVRHKVSDPGSGAQTSPLSKPWPDARRSDKRRRVRPQPRDVLRLAHTYRLLQACGRAAPGPAVAGVVGLDGDVVVWHDLEAPTWPGGRDALAEYDARFADRLAVANAAATGAEALAQPSRIVECRSCPWWPICQVELQKARDVSLVVRGEEAASLRAVGVRTVDDLAVLDPDDESLPPTGMPMSDAVGLAKAWLADLTVVRRVPDIHVPRAEVEVDVDMESFGDSGAYLWGALLTGADVGEKQGYRAFATWEPLPTDDEARSFAAFWQWLTVVRLRARARGLSFRAYCYNELAENRWLLSSAKRFAGKPGIPTTAQVQSFITSDAWFDLFGSVRDHFLCSRGKGLKTIAPAAGFSWRDSEASGENSMRWYRDAVGMDGSAPDDDQRIRLLEYNEDDVRATHALRHWMSSPAVYDVPYVGDL
ncbi:TM0106 family RecB-like putative nuclease [Actinophytocola algeriensis]|uniref:Putative RecB family nuclease n=1 Tax=Actinophytocola algeriensis TaxID=1768010 RepID=A0A7W7Q470_9PSEU|nr:TM0106 family RecB-like putative nuclease [Actinophytocola algeriensis]MBB4906767.1 putative RecB family nuclease [Actinophytocola algeriensis]MBE1478248.1 putative RecB family nuclease [Actinophytocola algeriensis]